MSNIFFLQKMNSTGMDQDPLDLVMRGKGSPEDQLLEEIKEVSFKNISNQFSKSVNVSDEC